MLCKLSCEKVFDRLEQCGTFGFTPEIVFGLLDQQEVVG